MSARSSTPTARDAVEAIWARSTPDFSAVIDAVSAGATLTSLAAAALDILVYRGIADDPDTTRLVSGEVDSYLPYAAPAETSTCWAVNLSHILTDNASEALRFAAITGGPPPVRSLRIHVLVSEDDSRVGSGYVYRLDLDPRSTCRVDWYGPFSPELFADVATGFALFVTHMVATVFPDDDGAQTFAESVEYIV